MKRQFLGENTPARTSFLSDLKSMPEKNLYQPLVLARPESKHPSIFDFRIPLVCFIRVNASIGPPAR